MDSLTGHCTAMSILCINYNMLTGECTRCASGSVLQDGVCFTPALGVDPNCALYSGVYCYGCNNGYRLVSFVCQKVQWFFNKFDSSFIKKVRYKSIIINFSIGFKSLRLAQFKDLLSFILMSKIIINFNLNFVFHHLVTLFSFYFLLVIF